MPEPPFEVYSTCPAPDGPGYGALVRRTAQWTEDAGMTGLLVYADNSLPDPWVVADAIVDATSRVIPLVAAQPTYAHPYVVAKKISTLALLTGRTVALNLVTGGFARHLVQLGDALSGDHDARYERLLAYAELLKALLAGTGPVTSSGPYFTANALDLAPPLPARHLPDFYVSGGSRAAHEVALRLGAHHLTYALPPSEMPPSAPAAGAPRRGIRIGIIARDTSELGWRVAHERFPDDGRGEALQRLGGRLSQSGWHAQLSALAASTPATKHDAYWIHPFRVYRTFCPYLVGSHAEVAELLLDYHSRGIRTVVMDSPHEQDDLGHTSQVMDLVARRADGAAS